MMITLEPRLSSGSQRPVVQILGYGFVAFALIGSLTVSAWAGGPKNSVRWESLPGMTAPQMQRINSLDSQWKRSYARYQPKIEADRSTLRTLIENPDASENQVMMIQNRLQRNEELLRNEATRIFLKKKNVLNPSQRRQFKNIMGH